MRSEARPRAELVAARAKLVAARAKLIAARAKLIAARGRAGSSFSAAVVCRRFVSTPL